MGAVVGSVVAGVSVVGAVDAVDGSVVLLGTVVFSVVV